MRYVGYAAKRGEMVNAHTILTESPKIQYYFEDFGIVGEYYQKIYYEGI
jgi:hypothetical protein